MFSELFPGGGVAVWTVEEGIARLREKGAKITSQRIAILKLLRGRCDHPAADMIYSELKADFPTISFATIYSTAQLLAASDLIQILTIDEKRVHFDPCPIPHAHFLCTECGKLMDVQINDDTREKMEDLVSFRIDSMQLFMYGVCQLCMEKAVIKEPARV